MMTIPHHHLLDRITTVSQGMRHFKMAYFIQTIFCGMESNVMGLKFPAVPIPTCHGSSRHLTNPPVMTLSSECVSAVDMIMKIHHWMLLNIISTEQPLQNTEAKMHRRGSIVSICGFMLSFTWVFVLIVQFSLWKEVKTVGDNTACSVEISTYTPSALSVINSNIPVPFSCVSHLKHITVTFLLLVDP